MYGVNARVRPLDLIGQEMKVISSSARPCRGEALNL
jgi:hypothetical protein